MAKDQKGREAEDSVRSGQGTEQPLRDFLSFDRGFCGFGTCGGKGRTCYR